MADNRGALPLRKDLKRNHSSCISQCTDPVMCNQFDQNKIENAHLVAQFFSFFFKLISEEQRERRHSAVNTPCKILFGATFFGPFVVFAGKKGHTLDCPHCQRQMLGNDMHFYLSDLLKGPPWPPVFFP